MLLTTRRVVAAAIIAALGAAFGPDFAIRIEPILRAVFGSF